MFLAAYTMSISLKLTQSINQIETLINEGIYEYINSSIKKNSNKVQSKFYTKIRSWINEQPEVISLTSSATQHSLGALFGLTTSEAQNAVRNIINSIVNSANIQIKFNNKLQGDITFNFQPIDFTNLLALQDGHRTTNKNIDLHWLDWLLTKGSTVIIVGYYYQPSFRGRSAAGHMTKGGSFRIPPSYAGDLNNNFITRAFQRREKDIEIILKGLLT